MKPWQLAYDIETVGFHAVANNKTAAVIATRFYQRGSKHTVIRYDFSHMSRQDTHLDRSHCSILILGSPG